MQDKFQIVSYEDTIPLKWISMEDVFCSHEIINMVDFCIPVRRTENDRQRETQRIDYLHKRR